MKPRRLLWQLYFPYVLVTLACLSVVTWHASSSLRRFHGEQASADLSVRAQLIREQVAPRLSQNRMDSIPALCHDLALLAHARVTVILSDGRVIGDSDEDPLKMENHAARPEFIDAIRAGEGVSQRYSHTLQSDMLYHALALPATGEPRAVVRAAIPLITIEEGLSHIYANVLLTALGAAIFAAVMSLFISRRITHPLEEIKRGAERFARGDFGTQLRIPNSIEIGALAEALNQMAVQLEDRIRTVVRQRNELEAVFSSMVEGVLAVDKERRLIGLNRAAARLLGVDYEDALGRKVEEVITHEDLTRVLTHSLSSEDTVEGDVRLGHPEERFLQAHGTVLRDARGITIGAMMVLEDVTRLRRLEQIRRDFVANVSHELRTPITSIKGFVETLLDGEVHDPESTQRFLQIIAKQSDRLNAIITDLLALSKIERDEEQETLDLETIHLRDVLELAVQTCEGAASEKEISIQLECDREMELRANPLLLEQAVVNLVDNAIKYSSAGSVVEITVKSGAELTISVRDHGCGIAAEHLPRLFERFYRVDKARSRKMGGTGLGLAIVKHIVQAHRGRVGVESKPGVGSTFTLHLPA